MAKILLVGVLLWLWAGPLRAQSNDVEYPTPVRENVIEGRIVPRDIGDARLTQHFYAFTGTPGEMFLRVASANLEGDIDLFIANGLRPILKVSLLAGSTPTTVNKIAYIKRRETMLLRVEARTPDDQPGLYKINLSGAFEVFGGPERTPPGVARATPESKPIVRVNSAGARLDPPPPPKPKPTPTPVETVAKATPPRPARAPRPTPTPKPADTPQPPPTAEPKTKNQRPETKPPANTAETASSTPPVPKPARTTRAPKPTTPPPEVAAPPPPKTVTPKPATKPKPPIVQTRLVLEFKNGSSISRAAVRRVTIEKGEVVIVTAEGKIERYSLLEITKMSVEPSVIQP